MPPAGMKPITEDEKQRLTEYLMARVVSGVSGRDRRDLVDLLPSRTIFAGVLQPPRASEIQAARSGAGNSDAPAGTALGLDFRVKPETQGGSFRLRISPRWSLYYSVFPSYKESRRANEILTGPDKEQVPTAEAELENTNEAEASPDVGAAPTSSGSVVLPRKWRRSDSRVEAVTVELYCDRSASLDDVGQSEIREAMEAMVASMGADHQARFRDLDDYLRTLASSAQSRLLMVAPYLSEGGMGGLQRAIAVSAQRGAWIRLITSDLDNESTPNRRAIATLLEGYDGDVIRDRLRVLKVSPILAGLVHAKCMVVDGKRGYLGSANFSVSGLERNLELGVVLSGEEARTLDELITYLEAHGELDDCTSEICQRNDAGAGV